MLQSCSVFVMVTIVMMVGMAMSTPMELLNLHGSPQVGYYVQLGLGSPYKVFSFLVDTGSTNLVIAGVKQTNVSLTFDPTKSSTFVDSNRGVRIEYSQGSFNGYLGTDVMWFATFHVNDVSVAIIEESSNFFGSDPQWQGIMGLAFDSLMKPNAEVTNSLWTLLQQQHSDIANVFSLKLCPPLDMFGEINMQQNSYMVIGGVDSSHYYGNIYYTSIVKEQYYNVLFSNISVGGVMIPMECSELNRDVTIVDSGTSEVFLNDDVFKAMVTLLKEYFLKREDLSPPDEFWSRREQLAWNTEHVGEIYDVFPVITFYFPLHGNTSLQFGVTMPPQLYLRKVDTTLTMPGTNISCNGRCDLFVFSIRSKPSGSLLGNNLMNGYTVVFDRQQLRLGFAVTTCDLRDNTRESHDQPMIIEPHPRRNCSASGDPYVPCDPSVSDDAVDCNYYSSQPSQSGPYVIIISTSLAVASVVLIIVIILYLLYCRHGKKSSNYVVMDELNNDDNNHDNGNHDNNHHEDNVVNDQAVVPAQEAGGSGDQMQVYSTTFCTPTESSQSECSKPSLQELINKKYMGQYHSVPLAAAERGKERSTLVGLQNYNSNLFDTVA